MSALTVSSLAVAVLALGAAAALAVALARTRHRLDELRASVRRLQETPVPSPGTELAVRQTQLDTVPAAGPTSDEVLRVAIAHPAVRVVALTYGLRRALRPESRDRVAAVMRREFRRRRKLRLRAGRRAARYARVGGPS